MAAPEPAAAQQARHGAEDAADRQGEQQENQLADQEQGHHRPAGGHAAPPRSVVSLVRCPWTRKTTSPPQATRNGCASSSRRRHRTRMRGAALERRGDGRARPRALRATPRPPRGRSSRGHPPPRWPRCGNACRRPAGRQGQRPPRPRPSGPAGGPRRRSPRHRVALRAASKRASASALVTAAPTTVPRISPASQYPGPSSRESSSRHPPRGLRPRPGRRGARTRTRGRLTGQRTPRVEPAQRGQHRAWARSPPSSASADVTPHGRPRKRVWAPPPNRGADHRQTAKLARGPRGDRTHNPRIKRASKWGPPWFAVAQNCRSAPREDRSVQT
jgi:hypothetical protein